MLLVPWHGSWINLGGEWLIKDNAGNSNHHCSGIMSNFTGVNDVKNKKL